MAIVLLIGLSAFAKADDEAAFSLQVSLIVSGQDELVIDKNVAFLRHREGVRPTYLLVTSDRRTEWTPKWKGNISDSISLFRGFEIVRSKVWPSVDVLCGRGEVTAFFREDMLVVRIADPKEGEDEYTFDIHLHETQPSRSLPEAQEATLKGKESGEEVKVSIIGKCGRFLVVKGSDGVVRKLRSDEWNTVGESLPSNIRHVTGARLAPGHLPRMAQEAEASTDYKAFIRSAPNVNAVVLSLISGRELRGVGIVREVTNLDNGKGFAVTLTTVVKEIGARTVTIKVPFGSRLRSAKKKLEAVYRNDHITVRGKGELPKGLVVGRGASFTGIVNSASVRMTYRREKESNIYRVDSRSGARSYAGMTKARTQGQPDGYEVVLDGGTVRAMR